jgi:hypothetical protein
MTKERNSSRETMKKPLMNLKEKRAAKKAKKESNVVFLTPDKK